MGPSCKRAVKWGCVRRKLCVWRTKTLDFLTVNPEVSRGPGDAEPATYCVKELYLWTPEDESKMSIAQVLWV